MKLRLGAAFWGRGITNPMSYLDSNTQRDPKAVVGALILNVFFGAVVIFGLTPAGKDVINTIIEAKDVKEVEKPKDEPPPPPEKLEEIPPYVPPPLVDIALPPPPTQAPVITTQTTVPKPEPVRVVEKAPEPAPPPRQIVKTVIDAKDFGKALSKKTRPDFPSSVIRQMESDGKTQSVVRGCRVYIGESGRVEKAECPNSEYPALAEKTQRWITGMKFAPATEDGKPVGSWVDQVPAVVWRLEE
jgi:periplasmic protein TonB